MTDALTPLPEDWQRGLAVVAHPDDMEYGAAAAVARWTAQGKDIRYVLATRGEAGIQSIEPSKAAAARAEEQVASCAVVGVSDVTFLDYPDGLLEATLDLRRSLAQAIRTHRPDVILSINFRESWGGPSWNHSDHRALGIALLDAVRDAANPWLFTELDTPMWDGVRFVAFGGSPQATHGVDIADTIDAGIASLRAHRLYLEHLGDGDTDPEAFLRGAASATGPRLGTTYATSFEVLTP